MIKQLQTLATGIGLGLIISIPAYATDYTSMSVSNGKVSVVITGEDPNTVFCEAEKIRNLLEGNAVINIPKAGKFSCWSPPTPVNTLSSTVPGDIFVYPSIPGADKPPNFDNNNKAPNTGPNFDVYK